MLEDIEDVILFRIANYFLRFSQEYRACFPDASFTDWYELVEYGTTNPEAVWLQRNGFTREAAAYITEKRSQYITFDDNDQLRCSIIVPKFTWSPDFGTGQVVKCDEPPGAR